jgi:hypothetical protein
MFSRLVLRIRADSVVRTWTSSRFCSTVLPLLKVIWITGNSDLHLHSFPTNTMAYFSVWLFLFLFLFMSLLSLMLNQLCLSGVFRRCIWRDFLSIRSPTKVNFDDWDRYSCKQNKKVLCKCYKRSIMERKVSREYSINKYELIERLLIPSRLVCQRFAIHISFPSNLGLCHSNLNSNPPNPPSIYEENINADLTERRILTPWLYSSI